MDDAIAALYRNESLHDPDPEQGQRSAGRAGGDAVKYLCLVAHWNACSDRVCAGYAQLEGSRRLLAAGIPPAQHGSVEVRPGRELQVELG